ncbi:MAG TPA: outer membrane beta-barrel protein [Bacteroidales bacterium]
MVQKKFYLLLSGLCFCNLNLFAQIRIGVSLGGTHNHLVYDVTDSKLTQQKKIMGYSIQSHIKYELFDVFSLHTGIGIFQKNYSFNRIGKYSGYYEQYNNTYLHMPVKIEAKVYEKYKFAVLINTGIFIDYWAWANIEGAIPNIFDTQDVLGNNGQVIQHLSPAYYSEKYTFNNQKDKRWEYGFESGIELDYLVIKKYCFFLGFDYLYSISDQQKKYSINQSSKKNIAISLSLGYQMYF